jgi:SAM-dependent methyltransferase
MRGACRALRHAELSTERTPEPVFRRETESKPSRAAARNPFAFAPAEGKIFPRTRSRQQPAEAITVPGFPDHFSRHVAQYSAGRPQYPAALGDWLASTAPGRNVAVDFGCGSGQLTTLLATRFARVIAIDASAEQIAAAPHPPNVEYRVGRAEDGIAEQGAADLIVVAQAAHWFDLPAFYRAVRAAAKPGALLTLVSYGRFTLEDPALDSIARVFYEIELAGFWPSERRHVELEYRSLEFPFAEIATPRLAIAIEWTPEAFLAYVESWSAVRSLERADRRGRFDAFAARVRERGDAAIRGAFPLVLRAARLERRVTE